MPKPILYSYQKCSTCRKATDWLRKHKIDFEERPIKEDPPSEAELKAMLALKDGEIRKLFNTSGMDYRAMGLKDRLPTLSEKDAFKLLRSNGMLVKRPFLIGKGIGLLGFREAEWLEALG